MGGYCPGAAWILAGPWVGGSDPSESLQWVPGPAVAWPQLREGKHPVCLPRRTHTKVFSWLWGEDSDAGQPEGNTSPKTDECFLLMGVGLSKTAHYLCVCAPVWVCMHVPAFWRGKDPVFDQSPKRVFDPKGDKKHSIIKRFNCVWIFAFPPGGANLLWCSQKLNLLKRWEKFKVKSFSLFKSLVLPHNSEELLVWFLLSFCL